MLLAIVLILVALGCGGVWFAIFLNVASGTAIYTLALNCTSVWFAFLLNLAAAEAIYLVLYLLWSGVVALRDAP